MNHLTVIQLDDTLVIDSRLIAKELGIQHKNLLENIRNHQTSIEHFGAIAFKSREFKTSQGNTVQECFAYLNEEQATFVMTLSRNTPKVIQCKQNLVRAFFEARKALQEVIAPTVQQLMEENERLRKRIQELEGDGSFLRQVMEENTKLRRETWDAYMINCAVIKEIGNYQWIMGNHPNDPRPFRLLTVKKGDAPKIENAVLGFTTQDRAELGMFLNGTGNIIREKAGLSLQAG